MTSAVLGPLSAEKKKEKEKHSSKEQTFIYAEHETLLEDLVLAWARFMLATLKSHDVQLNIFFYCRLYSVTFQILVPSEFYINVDI